MRTKKWKVIRVKGSRLRQLRTSLRTILELAINDKLERLGQLWNLYIGRFPNLVPSQSKREVSLITIKRQISDTYSNSLLRCSSAIGCISRKTRREQGLTFNILGEDMGWVPSVGRWVCAECHDFYYGSEEIRKGLEKEFNNLNTYEDFASKHSN